MNLARAAAGVLLAFGVAHAPGSNARADPGDQGARSAQVRRVEAELVDGVPHLSFDVRDFANRVLRRKLKSGLPQVLVTRVITRDERTGKVLALTAQSCRVIYDLWEGNYRVQHDVPGRSLDLTSKGIHEVVHRCLRADRLPTPLKPGTRLGGRRLYYEIAVEFNPMSKETVRRIRRWLSRPGADQLGGDAFFGSFVSIFVGQELGGAERVVRFRSQVWVVPR